MPGFDGTGPQGQGEMTGGGRGYCAVSISDNKANAKMGQGCFARGRGRGARNRFFATGLSGWMRGQQGPQVFGSSGQALSKEDELAILKSQVGYLQERLNAAQVRIQELETK